MMSHDGREVRQNLCKAWRTIAMRSAWSLSHSVLSFTMTYPDYRALRNRHPFSWVSRLQVPSMFEVNFLILSCMLASRSPHFTITKNSRCISPFRDVTTLSIIDLLKRNIEKRLQQIAAYSEYHSSKHYFGNSPITGKFDCDQSSFYCHSYGCDSFSGYTWSYYKRNTSVI